MSSFDLSTRYNKYYCKTHAPVAKTLQIRDQMWRQNKYPSIVRESSTVKIENVQPYNQITE